MHLSCCLDTRVPLPRSNSEAQGREALDKALGRDQPVGQDQAGLPPLGGLHGEDILAKPTLFSSPATLTRDSSGTALMKSPFVNSG